MKERKSLRNPATSGSKKRACDAVAAMCPTKDGYLIVTAQGLLYHLSVSTNDLQKLWVEVPVDAEGENESATK